jgi:hypothetical protein
MDHAIHCPVAHKIILLCYLIEVHYFGNLLYEIGLACAIREIHFHFDESNHMEQLNTSKM